MKPRIPLTRRDATLSPIVGEGRVKERFMESFDLRQRTHIGAMDLQQRVRCPRFSVFTCTTHPEGWTPNLEFMERASR
jgi:hypothetical protein